MTDRGNTATEVRWWGQGKGRLAEFGPGPAVGVGVLLFAPAGRTHEDKIGHGAARPGRVATWPCLLSAGMRSDDAFWG